MQCCNCLILRDIWQALIRTPFEFVKVSQLTDFQIKNVHQWRTFLYSVHQESHRVPKLTDIFCNLGMEYIYRTIFTYTQFLDTLFLRLDAHTAHAHTQSHNFLLDLITSSPEDIWSIQLTRCHLYIQLVCCREYTMLFLQFWDNSNTKHHIQAHTCTVFYNEPHSAGLTYIHWSVVRHT